MKMVIIGAGSAFGSRLSVDVLSREALNDSTIALCDIDEKKLTTVTKYVQKVIDSNNLPAKVESSTDRCKVLKDADFVVIAVSIGGPAYYDNPYKFEMGIPAKYGISQTVGDTVGAGGIFRALRTAPALKEMVEDINKLAPRSVILNYTNPMAILTWLLQEWADVPVVGLCHSVQGTAKQLCGFIDIPYEECGYWVAGINHMAWFLEFTHNGKDAYPQLREAMNNPEIWDKQPVRFEMMKEFDYFVTESSKHMSEYVPWYQHDKEFMSKWQYHGDVVKPRRQQWLEDMGIKAEQAESIELHRSHEYASEIMEAISCNTVMKFNGNVMNYGRLIENLPPNCCVEVPILTDKQGLHPCHVGMLPAGPAALNRLNINVQELTVEACRNKDRKAAVQACLLDPSINAVLTIADTHKMFDEMWEAEGDLLEAYNSKSQVYANA